MATEEELRRKGLLGFSEEDYAEWLRRKVERREDIQAHELERLGVKEAGLGERLGVTEVGLRKRKGMELEAGKPVREAEIGRLGALGRLRGAEAATEEYGLGLERELEPEVRKLMSAAVTLKGLDIAALREEAKAGLTGVPKEGVATPTRLPTTVAKPAARRRKTRPGVRRFLYGTPTKAVPGVIPGLLAPLTGLTNIAEWLRYGLKKGYEWARPYER